MLYMYTYMYLYIQFCFSKEQCEPPQIIWNPEETKVTKQSLSIQYMYIHCIHIIIIMYMNCRDGRYIKMNDNLSIFSISI